MQTLGFSLRNYFTAIKPLFIGMCLQPAHLLLLLRAKEGTLRSYLAHRRRTAILSGGGSSHTDDDGNGSSHTNSQLLPSGLTRAEAADMCLQVCGVWRGLLCLQVCGVRFGLCGVELPDWTAQDSHMHMPHAHGTRSWHTLMPHVRDERMCCRHSYAS